MKFVYFKIYLPLDQHLGELVKGSTALNFDGFEKHRLKFTKEVSQRLSLFVFQKPGDEISKGRLRLSNDRLQESVSIEAQAQTE